jgi:small-conductance mechanosensitive channel
VVLVLGLLRALVIRLINRRTRDVRSQYQWRKTTSYTIVVVGLLLVGRIWLDAFGEFGTFLGLVSAGIAIALKDPLTNIAGWGFIVWRRPFGPGDRIEIMGRAGDVIDQRIFQFTLLEIGTATGAAQSTGRIIHLPNGRAFTEPITNYTRGFPYVWNEIAVLVTFESRWRDAKEILLQIAHDRAEELSPDAERKVRQAAQEFMIFYSKLTPTVYTTVRDSGVELTIRYLVEPRRRRGSEEVLWEAILDAFDQRDDIDFAYPTQRFYHNVVEGKPDARAEPRGVTGNGGARSEGRGVEDGGPSRE